MTATERKAAERQRRKDAGLVRLEVYVRPEDRQAVRDFAESLTQSQAVMSDTSPLQQRKIVA